MEFDMFCPTCHAKRVMHIPPVPPAIVPRGMYTHPCPKCQRPVNWALTYCVDCATMRDGEGKIMVRADGAPRYRANPQWNPKEPKGRRKHG